MHPAPLKDDAPRRRDFSQVDVFTATGLLGNPVAVVRDGRGLGSERMAAFARWTNLSETTFLLPPASPEADYGVRIFTPGGEIPFAGHPTLGSCQAWLDAGGQPRDAGMVIQECPLGLVRIRRGERLAFEAPPSTSAPVDAALLARVVAALGLDPARVLDAAWLPNGAKPIGLLLDSAATVLALQPDQAVLKTLANVGVIGAHPVGSECQFEVRFFVPRLNVSEDPVTGSLNADLAHWLISSGRAPASYVAAQGQALGRAGRVHVRRDDQGTWIGGDVVAGVEGTVLL